jgi:hypothetical protein
MIKGDNMSVEQEVSPKTYHGMSTENKPAVSTAGSVYHCVDTGEQWLYYEGMWVHDLRLTYALDVAQGGRK